MEIDDVLKYDILHLLSGELDAQDSDQVPSTLVQQRVVEDHNVAQSAKNVFCQCLFQWLLRA